MRIKRQQKITLFVRDYCTRKTAAKVRLFVGKFIEFVKFISFQFSIFRLLLPLPPISTRTPSYLIPSTKQTRRTDNACVVSTI